MPQIKLGIDVGGTFTDLVIYNEETKNYYLGKFLSTTDNPSKGILSGVKKLFTTLKINPKSVDQVIHGTTMVANQIIERKGAIVGLISTKGFRDNLELGREKRYDMYDLFLKKAIPLVPRYLRHTITERIDWEGIILKPLIIEELDNIINIFKKENVKSIAISCMHSYRNFEHELKIRDYISINYPNFFVSISSEVSPEVREHQRTSTTVANAYVQPSIDLYLNDLKKGFNKFDDKCTIYIMLSGGGITTVDMARKVPVRMVESGPAAGAIAGAYYGNQCGESNIVTFDMGGTTAKICLINNNIPSKTSEIEVAKEHRFKKGSGLILKVPSIEMIEIGAGGGSIAHIDTMGLLKIGPQSAGAYPGPACYALGGILPTITDADLLLGLLNPEYFLGGQMKLDLNKAKDAIKNKISGSLKMDPIKSAQGIIDVVDENMATAARIYAAEQGLDIRRYTMVAFGGAGPLHAYKVAKILGISNVICPLGAGVMSSVGMLVAPKSIDLVQSYINRLDKLDFNYVDFIFNNMESQAKAILNESGVKTNDIILERSVDMRYVGQGFEINVSLPNKISRKNKIENLKLIFNKTYKNQFKRNLTHVPIEAITWRLTASEPVPISKINFETNKYMKNTNNNNDRLIYLSEENRFKKIPVFNRYELKSGFKCFGPALIEEKESTVFAGPDSECFVDKHLNLIMKIN